MFKKLRKFFHRHDWVMDDVIMDQCDKSGHVRYNTYIYQCRICGKKKTKNGSYERRKINEF
jgi:ribosomal protein L37AE/L43A